MRSPLPPVPATDQELLTRVRGGDSCAYGELWRRHSGAVTAILRLETRLDADDLTAEVFTRILATIRGGNGPETAFRPYALVAARNLAAEWGKRQRREIPVDEEALDAESSEPPVDESSVVLPHRRAAARVFSSLPTRWQEVLWYLEVEQLSATEVAPLIGLNANSTVQLAFRAREGFRQAWIQEHLSARPASTRDCHWVDRRVGRHVRGKLTPVERAKFERHATACERCATVVEEGNRAERGVIFALLPIALLGGASGAYLAAATAGETRRADDGADVVSAGPAVRAGVRALRSRPTTIAAAAGSIAAVAVIVVAGLVMAQTTVPSADSPAEAGAVDLAQGAAPGTGLTIAQRPLMPPVSDVSAPPEAHPPVIRDERGPQSWVGPELSPPVPVPATPIPPIVPVPADVTSLHVVLNGSAYPTLYGDASPGAEIEILIDPSGAAIALTATADPVGSFGVKLIAIGLSGMTTVIARQVVGGVASAWTWPIHAFISPPPQGEWTWTAPSVIEVTTTSLDPGPPIAIWIDGVIVGVFTTNQHSGESFAFLVTGASPVVEIGYENGGALSPRSLVAPQ